MSDHTVLKKTAEDITQLIITFRNARIGTVDLHQSLPPLVVLSLIRFL